MCLHSFLFISYIVSYVIASMNSMATIRYREADNWLLGCRYLIASEFFNLISKLFNTAILSLITYMCSLFSQPLGEFGKSFLLVYKGDLDRLSDQIEEVGRDQREKDKAQRYQKQAIKDADRRIAMIVSLMSRENQSENRLGLRLNTEP